MGTIIAIANAILTVVNSGGGTPPPPLDFVIAENGVDFLITEAGDNISISDGYRRVGWL
jgi:hypothetical protein